MKRDLSSFLGVNYVSSARGYCTQELPDGVGKAALIRRRVSPAETPVRPVCY